MFVKRRHGATLDPINIAIQLAERYLLRCMLRGKRNNGCVDARNVASRRCVEPTIGKSLYARFLYNDPYAKYPHIRYYRLDKGCL